MADWVQRATDEFGKIPMVLNHVPDKLPELGAMSVGIYLMHWVFDAVDEAMGYDPLSGFRSMELKQAAWRSVEESLIFTSKYALARASGLLDLSPAVIQKSNLSS